MGDNEKIIGEASQCACQAPGTAEHRSAGDEAGLIIWSSKIIEYGGQMFFIKTKFEQCKLVVFQYASSVLSLHQLLKFRQKIQYDITFGEVA